MHEVVSLHKYYLWATYMAAELEKEMPKITKPTSWADPTALRAFMLMSYWYATLYVVAEGWKDLGLTDPTIDVLLADPTLMLLKRYRNGVYHFQADYFDERYRDFTDQGQAAINWIHTLHAAFTAYFTR